MGKVIMLSDDVYKRLKMMKGPGESFSDVIERLLKYKPKLGEIAGSKTIIIKDWRRVKESLKVREKLDEERRKYLLGLLGE